ncbi:MAG: hypothetical protein N3B21_12840 [Clostridia bacterium]|nr:hypothetical protein [Clostridia bacterium]
MKLYGRIVKDGRVIRDAIVEKNDENMSFRDSLEHCLINLCRELESQVPMWLKKNSTEFINFHKTSFDKEHFIENIKFDRLEIRIV